MVLSSHESKRRLRGNETAASARSEETVRLGNLLRRFPLDAEILVSICPADTAHLSRTTECHRTHVG